jgi:hypothetical protein
MEDEFLAEYLNNPALQAKYGNYRNYRDFMIKKQSLNQGNTGILSNISFPEFNLSNIKNLGGKIVGGITSAAMNIPGLGFMIDAFTRPQYPSDAMSRSFAVENYGDPYNYNMGSGNLTGQDPFGINTISFAGNYPAYYDQYVRDYEAGKYSPTSQFAKDKYAHGLEVIRRNQRRIEEDFANTDAEDDIGAGNYIAPSTSSSTPKNINRPGGNGVPNRPDKSGATGIRAGGFTNPGRGSYGPHYARGGIVSLYG